MMKKKVFFAALATLALASCTQEDLSVPSEKNVNVDLEAIAPTRPVMINVPAGQAAVVLSNAGDTIAFLQESREIALPTSLKKVTSTGVTTDEYNNYNVTVNYITEAEIKPYMPTYKCRYYETIAFEDLNADDYDYNDLIFHVEEEITDQKVNINIQPIAFGAENTIDLYATVTVLDDNNNIVSETESEVIKDVKKNLFNAPANSGYINTDTAIIKKNGGLTAYPFTGYLSIHYGKNGKLKANQHIDIQWTIVVNGEKKFVSIPMTQRMANNEKSTGKNYNTTFDKNKIPFGLVFCDIYGGKAFRTNNGLCGADWFVFPVERESIAKVYPNFFEWLNGAEKAAFDFSSPKGIYINAIGNVGETSLYEYNLINKNAKTGTIVTRKDLTFFDQSRFVK